MFSAIFLPIFFAFGAVIGSFLNVVILRLHAKRSFGGRSECPHCHKELASVDLVPIVSFLLQR
jgi:prepilin signal peptidase PulO-like enzyme (type II secretory pathway)